MKKLFAAILCCSISSVAFAQPEINVTGNTITITDGDVTPSFSDWTEYISILECTGTVVRSYTIQNTGTSDLQISSVTIAGPEASDFTITGFPATTIAAGGSSVLWVTCNPIGLGPRNATVVINNDDSDESVYDFAIRGTGLADVVNPTITCPGNISVNATAGLCSAVVTFTTPTATDNCPTAITIAQTAGLPSGSAFPVGATVNTFRATDASGNFSTCSFTVTVNDAQAPVLYNMSTVASSNATGGAYSDGWHNGDNDGTGFGSWTLNASTGNTAQAGFLVGSSTTNGSGIDSNGDQDINSGGAALGMYANSSQATQATRPLSAPLSICRTLRVELDNGNVDNGQIIGFQLQNSAGNSLGEVRYRGSQAGYEIVDINGITPFTSIPFTDEGIIIEVTPTAVGISSIKLTRKVNGATQTLTSALFPGGGNQTISRIMIFNSNAGSGAAKTLYVNNLTVVSATAGCPTNISVANNVGVCGATVVYNPIVAIDNCSTSLPVIQTAGLPSGSLFPVGTTINSFTATDGSGNTGTCSFTVVVADTSRPVANCQNRTLYLNGAGNANIIAAMVNNGSTDNCGITSMSVTPTSFSCANVGANNVTLTVTDAAGNSSTCTSVVTVLDSIRPVITSCPGPQTIVSGPSCTALVPDFTSLVTGTDICGVTSITQLSPLPGSALGLGSTVPVTVRVSDASGNFADCVFNLTVLGPEINVKGNGITIADEDVTPSASDHTDFGSVLTCTGNIIRTYTVENTGTTTLNAGTISITGVNQSDFSLFTQSFGAIAPGGSGTFQIRFDPQADGIRTAIIHISNDDCDEAPYDFTVQGTGNADLVSPVANCQNVTVYLNGSGSANVIPAMLNNGSSDNCGIASMSVSQSTFSCANVGANNVTLTVIDGAGNSSTCTSVVTVLDSIRPVVNTQNITVQLNAAGTVNIIPAMVNNGSSDACGIASMSVTPNSFSCADLGANTVTLTVTDVNGNSRSGNAIVTVMDTIRPVANCQNITTYLSSSGTVNAFFPLFVSNTFNDNCGSVSISFSALNFNCSNIGANNVTVTGTDDSGNMSSCISVVTVLDTIRPATNCQNLTLHLNSSGTAGITAAMVNNGSTDACGIASMSVAPNSFSCANVGANNVVLSVTDVNGNVSTCNSVVTVIDTVRPVAIAQNLTVTLTGGTASVTAAAINNGSSDACGIASMTVTPNTFTCSNLGPNTVTLTVTDANGNSSTATAVVTVLSDLTSNATLNSNVSCFGGNDGQATISTTGGAGPFTYSWSPSGGTGATATGLSAGTYTATVTDGGGCTTSSTVTITQPGSAVTASSVAGTILCNGGSTTVTVTGSGGISPYSGAGTFTVTAGTYTYTVTDANGCAAATTVTVTEPSAVTPGVSSTPILCNGGTSTVTVSANGGTSPYSGTGTFTVSAGSYSYLVTDANGCPSTASVTITQPSTLNSNATSTAIACNGGSAQVTVGASGGTAPYTGTGNFTVTAGTYSYIVTDANGCTSTSVITVTQPSSLVANSSATAISCNGGSAIVTVIATGGSGPYTGTGAYPVTAGTYSYTVTDANGCTATTSITVTEPTALAASSSATSIACNGGNATVTVVGAGGTSPYTGEGSFTVNAGTYSYTVTDANGCTTTTSITVTEPTALSAGSSATSIACNGGTATVTVVGAGGTSPYTGEGTFTVTSGTYSYTVTDANGCTATTSITITEPTILSANSSATAIACNGGTATITVVGAGGASPYTGEGTFTVTAGTYSYTVTDANGCTATTSITVTEPTAISTSVVSVNVLCFGDSTGAIDLTVTGGTGPYTFDWNNGAFTTEDLVNIPAGTYNGVLTDANGCTDSGTIIITEPNALSATITSQSGPTTCGGADGTIDNTVNGGTMPYSFLWSNSAITEDLTGVIAGLYTCDITDANGCTTQTSAVLNDPNAPTVTLGLALDTICVDDAALVLTGESPSGGTFSGPGVTSGSFNPSVAGVGVHVITYSYTDISGCSGSAVDSIYVDLCLNITSTAAGNDPVIYPNPNSGTFTIQTSLQAVEVQITDASGKLIEIRKVGSVSQEQFTIDVAGVYWITSVGQDGSRSTHRVIVTR